MSDVGGDVGASLTENLTRDVGTTLYSAPEQLRCTEHSTKVTSYQYFQLVMAAVWNRAGHYIFILCFLSIFFFPRLILAAVDWMSAILLHMAWP